MARESLQAKAGRTQQIIAGLKCAYPDAHCELNYSTPLELLIATILSAQCTDKQVNIVTRELFKKYRTAADYANATPAEFEQDIRRIGLFRAKAKNIQACCRALIAQHGGEVPRTMEELTALGGVGRKTANVVLNTAFHQPTMAVDTHIFRVANRTGLAPGKNVLAVEKGLLKHIPKEYLLDAHHWLILHGRYTCVARTPKCGQCIIADLCDFKEKTG